MPAAAAAAAAAIVVFTCNGIVAGEAEDHVLFQDARFCRGNEVHVDVCEDTPECDVCIPRDCVFSPWSTWQHAGGCTGLVTRRRNITVASNKCGTPCSGTTAESRRSNAVDCDTPKLQDCVFGAWTEWSSCSSATDQRNRSRIPEVRSRAGGRACKGIASETEPCGEQCEVNDWGSWSQCSSSCGAGLHSRFRRMARANLPSSSCGLSLEETGVCNADVCPQTEECVVSGWTTWTACAVSSNAQQYRTRRVEHQGRTSSLFNLSTLTCNGSKNLTACSQPLRFASVATLNGRPIDMEVVSNSGDISNPGVVENEEVQLEIFQINVERTMTLTFRFVDAATREPVLLQDARIYAFLFGLNLTVPDSPPFEKYTAGPIINVETTGGRNVFRGISQLGVGEQKQASPLRSYAVEVEFADVGTFELSVEPLDKVTPAKMLLYFGSTVESILGCSHVQAVTTETRACSAVVDSEADCGIAPWSTWGACSVSCGSGQRFRNRSFVLPPENLASACPGAILAEVGACDSPSCSLSDKPCKFEDWGQWGACSATCGDGSRLRDRKVAQIAAEGGQACFGALSIVESCSLTPCTSGDCVIGQWQEWGGCTCTCGGGSRTRTRLIERQPMPGGKLCNDGVMKEARPCATQPCQTCIDGRWSAWGSWSICSATCEGGLRSRHRAVEVHPNTCGQPAVGLQDDVEACNSTVCGASVDCSLSDWSIWSVCSGACFGIQQRSRTVDVQPVGLGKSCSLQALDEARQCNPGRGEDVPSMCEIGTPTAQQCVLADWRDWSTCSTSCDKGVKTRTRSVISAGSFGAVCDTSLSEVAPCETAPCNVTSCVDCQWGEWEEWGECTKCGQKYRKRFIKQMPSACGKPCDAGNAYEVSEACEKLCLEFVYCAWSEWSLLTAGCPKTCGSATQMRTRNLQIFGVPDAVTPNLLTVLNATKPEQYLFKGISDLGCSGAEIGLVTCSEGDCPVEQVAPVNCEFGAWQSWSLPGNDQLCGRKRVLAKENNFGGKSCTGPLSETRSCPRVGKGPEDCKLSEWMEWSSCLTYNSTQATVQRSRGRHIVTNPSRGGLACTGPLEETEPCPQKSRNRVNCDFETWTPWSSCSTTCGVGSQMRHRGVAIEAQHGGSLCSGSLSEIIPCEKSPCKAYGCVLSDWEEWSGCLKDGQRYRTRRQSIVSGAPAQDCFGNTRETVQCGDAESDICEVSAWTAWSSCDATCGGGQTYRQRTVVKREGDPVTCPNKLTEAAGCNAQRCLSQPCEVSSWSSWSACTATCDGYRSRDRKIVSGAEPGGATCAMSLSEVSMCASSNDGACSGLDAPTDCLWGDWSAWAGCSCSCGGGQRSRFRDIIVFPKDGGRMCEPLSKDEVEPCNTSPCRLDCVDGEWAQWTDWYPCSASCRGGLSWRTRGIKRMANDCGTPPAGDGRQTRSCNDDISCVKDVDCIFDGWNTWSTCSSNCDGIKERSRAIAVMAQGCGTACIGATQQWSPCNPGIGESKPAGCGEGPPVDCTLSLWSEWSACSSSCGSGHHDRSRKIVSPSSNGGKVCDVTLRETAVCEALLPCPTCELLNCVWGEWGEWEVCDKCGGERTRRRHIVQHPKCGGDPCAPQNDTEVGACPRACHEVSMCAWSDWKAWSPCSTTCGAGSRTRERELRVMGASLTDSWHQSASQKFHLSGPNMLAREGLGRQQDLMVAFIGGLVSLSIFTLVFRRMNRSPILSRIRSLLPCRGDELHDLESSEVDSHRQLLGNME
eukprot:TRINITY_DN61032_c0_g1_i1.p1 TRINITY_DN61032_c0_g1~~TRINITY_DN61032_c0_g1_i1.p1  ORF type:complete len:1778 (+),score=249.35 TRINITY_DN61032_c0_g1_i1:101-5335(+)